MDINASGQLLNHFLFGAHGHALTRIDHGNVIGLVAEFETLAGNTYLLADVWLAGIVTTSNLDAGIV